MDPEAISNGIGLFAKAVTALKTVKDLLPNGPEKDAATEQLLEAEKQLKIAEAEAAQNLGYEICKCTWPPQIMTATKEAEGQCPECGKIVGQNNENELKKTSEIDQEQVSILKLLAKHESLTIEQIAGMIGVHQVKVELYLEEMDVHNFVFPQYNMCSPTRYGLHSAGRKYLVQNNLV